MKTSKNWTWPKAAAAAGVVGTAIVVLSCAFGAGQNRGGADRRLDQLEQADDDHETRIRTVESKIHEIRADVRWLREDREAEKKEASP